jgi:hypothetical protein
MTSSAGASQHRQLPPDIRQPVDPRLEYWPVIHCELCGSVAIAMMPSTQFCIICGLYVCAGCWREAAWRCSTCALLVARPSRKLHVWMLRRADRRLREVIADLAEPDDDTEHGWDRQAQATIKTEASLQAREVAVAHLPRARQQSRVADLLRRIERDSAAARAAIERPRVSLSPPRLAPTIPSRGSVARLALLLRLPRRSHERIMWIAGGTAAAVVTAIIALSLIATELRERGIAEGVLSGGPQEGAASSPSFAPAGPRPGVTASPTLSSVAVFDFDGRQMGSGLGPGWREAGGGNVILAAFPTGVDRSARLVADGTTPLETCRSFDAGVRVVAIDVFLDPLIPVAARVELTDPADSPIIAIDLSESRTVVSTPADVVEEAGLQLATWTHVEMRSENGGMAWKVTQEENGAGPSVQGRTEGRTTEGLTEICLGIEASKGGGAHYDNLTIQWTSGEGG